MSVFRAVATATATATATASAAAGVPAVPAVVAGAVILAIVAGALHALIQALLLLVAILAAAGLVWAWLRRPRTTVIVQPTIRVRLVEHDAPVPCYRCGLPAVTTAQITGPDGATTATLCDTCLTQLLGEVERRALTTYGTTRPALERSE